MSSSTLNLRFLLDENVKLALSRFLTEKGFVVKRAAKGTPDKKLAEISKKEQLILVINDKDFSEYTKDDLYGLIWLQIPQADTEMLLHTFQVLVKECRSFEGKIVILSPDKWEVFPLPVKVEV